MALIAPGAFLWLTYAQQSAYGAPIAGSAMWLGILFALLLCLATAIAYAELSKLYPGAGSSYFFAEQAFLSKKEAFKWARLMKFMVGWASHLYYWVYPGVMVGVTAVIFGYMIGQIFPTKFNPGQPSALLMLIFCVFFSLGVAYIAFRGVGGTTGVNMGINVVQIVALLIFSCMAIGHRWRVKDGDVAWTLDSTGVPIQFVQDSVPDTTKPQIPDPSKKIPDPADKTGKTMIQDPKAMMQDPAATILKVTKTSGDSVPVYVAVDAKGAVINDKDGNPVTVPTDDEGKLAALPTGAVKAIPQPFTITYKGGFSDSKDADGKPNVTFDYHDSAKSVIAPHKGSFVIIQACIAILILVGFESVTAMGEEAKNAKRDIPKAVILALVIQGGFCYLFEYFAANYFLSSAYKNTTAAGSSAPIGDMMQLVGAYWFGSPKAGFYFMMIQAVTVFLALIGTTLSCVTTGARVTYAMGRDQEMGAHFGMLHDKHLSPHRAIWTLAIISIFIGMYACYCFLCGPAATAGLDTNLTDAMKAGIWYKFGAFSFATAGKIPNSLLIVTLVSNFGTFLLYMITCVVAIVAFREHHMFNGIKHMAIPIFGLLANLGCMLFYLVGPFMVPGMSKWEPFIALGVVALWGIYGALYFTIGSKKTGKPIILTAPPTPAPVSAHV
jgi:amino acid transporter